MPKADFPILNRRRFLGGCAAAAACAACPSICPAAPADDETKARVRLVFAHPPKPIEGWPYKTFDHAGRKVELTSRLRAACPDVEFVTGDVPNAEAAKEKLASDRDIDGYVVWITGIPSDAYRPIAFSGRPTVLVDDLYGGTGALLNTYPDAKRKGMPVTGVSSSDIKDVAQAARTFTAIKRLRSSVLLNVSPRNSAEMGKAIQTALGPEIRSVSAEELNALYTKADRAEARKWAKTWMANAAKVVEPTAEEIGKSGAMYVAMRELIAQQKARGIAVDCLNLFYGGKLSAYPCLGFFQLNDDGLVGACEADIQSAATMLAITNLTGRPGYISDPVIDTSKNQIIYAHCVAPSKVYGPGGPANPYHIRSHSEDRKGASIRSLMPLGQITTTLKFIPDQKAVVVHQAKTVENIDDDKACRTKLAAEVKDARKLLSQWQYGWHRVTVYGDIRVPLELFADLTGTRIIEEG